jgi:hypothetical protein
MATETKAIDLGKLQDTMMFHTKQLSERKMRTLNAINALQRAQKVVDNCRHNEKICEKLLDKARESVLEGARTIAQG